MSVDHMGLSLIPLLPPSSSLAPSLLSSLHPSHIRISAPTKRWLSACFHAAGSDTSSKMADKLSRLRGNIRSVLLRAVVAEGRMTHASVEFDGVSGGQEELRFIGCVLAECVKAAEKGVGVGVGVQSFLHKALTASRQPPGTLLH